MALGKCTQASSVGTATSKILHVWTILYILAVTASAQPAVEFFNDTTMITGSLTSDYKYLKKNKMNTSYQPATLQIDTNDTTISYGVKIKTRGEFRRKECSFPPIKIKFAKKDFTGSSVENHNKVKWVTHCKPGKSNNDKVIEEYLIYKAYELLTSFSFRTRLMQITYLDSISKRKPETYYAFLIEDIDQVAFRNDAVEVDQGMHPELADREMSTIMPLALYMIGFTDWSVLKLHNMKLIQLNDNNRRPIPVPYDFDYSGLIDPSYAVPPEFLEIESVRERVYRGFCRLDGEWNEPRQLFLEKKEAILDLWRNESRLSAGVRKNDIRYLESFFEIVADDKLFERTVKSQCRGDLGTVIGGVNTK